MIQLKVLDLIKSYNNHVPCWLVLIPNTNKDLRINIRITEWLGLFCETKFHSGDKFGFFKLVVCTTHSLCMSLLWEHVEGQRLYNAALKCYPYAATSKFGMCKYSLCCFVVLAIRDNGKMSPFTKIALCCWLFYFRNQTTQRQFMLQKNTMKCMLQLQPKSISFYQNWQILLWIISF